MFTTGSSLTLGRTTDASGTAVLDWLPKDFAEITFHMHPESGYETQIDGNGDPPVGGVIVSEWLHG